MSSHTGVSCDACMRTNFPGRRYKCLLCDNYDLCGSCYDLDAESQNHKNDHPMQCILTETACELFYAGESIPRRTVVSLTCPHCGISGFIPRTLLIHCVEKHPSVSPQTKNSQAVMCPICVTSPSHRNRSRFTVLTDHMLTVHDDGTGGDDEYATISLSITKTRRGENEEEDSDEDDDEEDESSLNDLEHRAFIEEEQRRQEAARQRLAHASSLAAVIRNEYAAGLTGNTNSQRRSLVRQTAIRGIRGGLRGHFTNFPYGTVSRTTTGPTSSTSNRGSSDTSTGNSSQNTPATDPYTALIFAQDPMLEFVSRLVNNQSSSSSSSTTPPINSSNSPFLFTPSMPIHVPSSMATTSELARFQQQIENNESINSLKSTLLNSKQKRSSHTQQQQQQQQQQTPSSQSMILSYPLGYDYQLWQQNFSALQPTINNLSFLTGTVPTDLTTGNSNSLTKNSQQLNREYNPRSLLGKILRNDYDVNNDEMNETRTQQSQNHISFLQSILFSSMTTNLNEEPKENELIINKENLY
ncbi:unnamed protein product [Rotaria sordida]|uniref:RING-type E3 ubiquitin transferase n=2 Tax=Rotaria sordida TaxID=392033 RepID=A0A813VAM0_9BILA|nr:unnamed protein product [Rotaria sordida]CAF0833943.1 unnamed protein product [Rotaria sordida]CAF3744384.1 unnamed protein product [Rotaria sordida]